jgi:hypothetical protein
LSSCNFFTLISFIYDTDFDRKRSLKKIRSRPWKKMWNVKMSDEWNLILFVPALQCLCWNSSTFALLVHFMIFFFMSVFFSSVIISSACWTKEGERKKIRNSFFYEMMHFMFWKEVSRPLFCLYFFNDDDDLKNSTTILEKTINFMSLWVVGGFENICKSLQNERNIEIRLKTPQIVSKFSSEILNF